MRVPDSSATILPPSIGLDCVAQASSLPRASRQDACATGMEVFLRALDLPALAGNLAVYRIVLSADELRQAGRFALPRLRDRFIIVRAGLRGFLGELLGAPPPSLVFALGSHGKPYLNSWDRGRPRPQQLHFNVAHTDGLALLAAAWGREIGIDVEAVRPWPAADKVAARFFSPREQAALRALPEPDRLRAFFTCWTRKEALLKALGRGLTFPLRAFSVTLAPGDSPRLIEMDGDPDAPARWQLRDLPLPEPYVGCLSFEGGKGPKGPKGPKG